MVWHNFFKTKNEINICSCFCVSILVKRGGYIFILNYRSIKQDSGYLFGGG